MSVTKPSIAVTVMDDPFRQRLLKALGINPEIAGDIKIEAPVGGVYAINIWLWITTEAWEYAQKGEG